MKLISYLDGEHKRFGAVLGDKVVDLHAADNRIASSFKSFLYGGGDVDGLATVVAHAKADATRELARLQYDVALPHPGKMLCLGQNYLEHAKEGSGPIPQFPNIFMRVETSLVAHNQPIIRPKVSDKLDYEAELCVIIGKRIRHATLDNALSVVFGYSCFNDVTLRDYQRRTTQFTIGKNFDDTGAFGPWVVTADDLPKGGKGLAIKSRLNGIVMQSDSTSSMMFPVAETIVCLTEAMTLEPGDVIITGTPAGVGYPRNPQVFMKPGDVIEVEIEGIGTLHNPVEDEQ